MNEDNVWEQPENGELANVTDVTNEESANNSQDNGSQLGKFSDAKSLLTAYNNLQAEFTRKCQKLSELTKTETKQSENIEYNWNDRVSQFLKENQDAKNYAQEISQVILDNENIKNNEKALELAWAKVIQNHYKDPQKIVEDQNFVNEFVLNNEEIKKKVMEDYILKNKKQTPPPIISASSGGNVAVSIDLKTDTMRDAKKLVEEMFNIKGEK